MSLDKLGWNDYFKEQFNSYEGKEYVPARVIMQQKNSYLLRSEYDTFDGRLSGRFVYKAKINKDFPAVGDWVAIKRIDERTAMIHELLERENCFSRKMPISGGRKIRNGIIVGGSIEEQVVAANIDTAFIVSGLDDNFNIGRIERYLTLAYNSKVNPVIILNKMDLCENVSDYIERIHDIAKGVPIHCISVIKNIGMEIFDSYISIGKTVVFFGSSGVGKSTITNYLLGEERQKTNAVSDAHGKGRHTTTSKEMFFHDSGAMVIDTPGLRELQLWGNEDVLEETYEDITSIIKMCKFHDCSHQNEPGCAVKKAIEDGVISEERFERYKRQLMELQRLDKNRRKFEINMGRKNKKRGLIKDDI